MKTINNLNFKDLEIQSLSFDELLETEGGHSFAYMVGKSAAEALKITALIAIFL